MKIKNALYFRPECCVFLFNFVTLVCFLFLFPHRCSLCMIIAPPTWHRFFGAPERGRLDQSQENGRDTGVRLYVFAWEYPRYARPLSLPPIPRSAPPRPRHASPRSTASPAASVVLPSPICSFCFVLLCFVYFLVVFVVCVSCLSVCLFRVNDALVSLEHGTHLTSLIRACIALGEWMLLDKKR